MYSRTNEGFSQRIWVQNGYGGLFMIAQATPEGTACEAAKAQGFTEIFEGSMMWQTQDLIDSRTFVLKNALASTAKRHRSSLMISLPNIAPSISSHKAPCLSIICVIRYRSKRNLKPL